MHQVFKVCVIYMIKWRELKFRVYRSFINNGPTVIRNHSLYCYNRQYSFNQTWITVSMDYDGEYYSVCI